MTPEEFRNEMYSFRQLVAEEGISLKDSQFALAKLRGLYGNFDVRERSMADDVLSEWVLSESEAIRFDALALIFDFRIEKALSALDELSKRLLTNTNPGAPFELKKISRIISRLKGETHEP